MSKEKFIQSVVLKVSSFMPPDQADRLRDILIKELSSYDLSETGTEIVPYDDENDRMLKTYCACISLDGKSPKTIYQYSRTIKRLADTVGKKYRSMTAYDVRLFFALQKEHGVSNRSIENMRSYISAFFQWMQREEYITVNPVARIKPIQYTDDVKQPFSNVDIDRLRGACKNPKERAIIEVLLSSGVRVSELCALNIDDVNIHDKTVHVRHGKGDKARITYIDDLAVMHLRHYMSTRKDDNEALFVNYRKTRMSSGGAEHIIKTVGSRAGIEKTHPHRFRRTLATTLAKRGMAVQDIQKILGHSDIATTMIYVSVSDQRAKLEYQKFTA